MKMWKSGEKIKVFIISEDGASAVEYGMAVGLVGLVSFVALSLLGKQVNKLLTLYFKVFLWW